MIRSSIAFHWCCSDLPELVCLKPIDRKSSFSWSGEFDPLLIGSIPLRTRSTGEPIETSLCSVRVDVDLRPGTGKTGINISLKEESSNGNGSIYRIENSSPFPIWVIQDVLSDKKDVVSDVVFPHGSIAYAFDQPLSSGKINSTGRARDPLLVRLCLAPYESAAGKESAQTLSLASEGETALLYPSKLSFLGSELRRELQGISVAATTGTDGPTRVLMLRYVQLHPDFPLTL